MKSLVFFLSLVCLPLSLFSRPVETFYGTLEVEETVLLELIDSRPMQRLKKIHQYGISYYTSHSEEYSRYDHSLGVFAILRLKGSSLTEQIAGLLHDVSHTVFSHVGDYVFKHNEEQQSYQDRIHEWFLEKYGIGKILRKHGYSVAQVHPDSGAFLALEQDLPNLCADRIDYNLQGAYHRGFLSKLQVLELLKSLEFEDEKWTCSRPDLMEKMVRFSLHMTECCWGSADNYLKSTWLAEAMLKAIKLKKLSWEEVYYGTDDKIWNKLRKINHPYIVERFEKIMNVNQHFTIVTKGKSALKVKRKFRGIDPLMRIGSKIKPLTKCDRSIARAYRATKKKMEQGWSIEVHTPIVVSMQ